jgi:hypothetical protein
MAMAMAMARRRQRAFASWFYPSSDFHELYRTQESRLTTTELAVLRFIVH